MRFYPLLLACLLLAGCSQPASPSTHEATPPAESAFRFEGVGYACPGGRPSSVPCGADDPSVAGLGFIDLAFRSQPPLVAAIGANLASGFSVAPVEPGLQLLMSSDRGVTWTPHPLPTVASQTTRTGTRTPYWATLGFLADGSVGVLLQLNGDTERSIVGGEVPEPLRGQNDIAFVRTLDGGASWETPVTLSSDPASSYSARLTALGDGTLFAGWHDVPGDLYHAAWSTDGIHWITAQPIHVACESPTAALAFGARVLVACLDRSAATAGPPRVVAIDRANETLVDLHPETKGGFPECDAVQLLPNGGVVLLVLSHCPGVQIYRSANGGTWEALAPLTASSLGLKDNWGSESLAAKASSLDELGNLHVLLSANRLFETASAACYCVETRTSHLVFDVQHGLPLDDHELYTYRMDDGTQEFGVAALATPARDALGFFEGQGWILWRNPLTRLGYFSVTTSAIGS